MRLTRWNRNLVGTQFGGSLYFMCDRFFVIMLMMRLGPGYVVRDKSAAIEFLRLGRGTVVATFELSQARVDEVRREADRNEKVFPVRRAPMRPDARPPARSAATSCCVPPSDSRHAR
jgi:hypothetical protein